MSENPSAIRADIADTRERLSNTIEEIGERLNPQTLKENVKDSIREATIGRVSTMARQAADTVSRTTTGITDSIRENPIPVAMIAMGIGWLVWNSRAGRENGRLEEPRRTDEVMADIGHPTADLYGSAVDVTRRGARRVEDSYHENPLAMGAVAMAVGLAAGVAAPVSDREVRWMGDAPRPAS